MTARRVLLSLLLCAIPLLAQEHPNIARGFTPEHMYDFSAIDSVNMFNGNMTLRIPIGPELRANGVMPYRLTLAYNSGSWDFIDVPEDPPQLTAIPRKRSNSAWLQTSYLYDTLGRLTTMTPLGQAGPSEDADVQWLL